MTSKSQKSKMYTLPIIGSGNNENDSVTFRNPIVNDGPLIDLYDTKIRSLYAHLLRAINKYGERAFLGTRTPNAPTYTWKTYHEIGVKVKNFGSGLINMGLTPKTKVGIFSKNCQEWIISEYGCYYANLITVPLYDTLGLDAVKYICNHSELSLIIISAEKLPVILGMKELTPKLEKLIIIGDLKDEMEDLVKKYGIEIHKFQEVIKLGVQKEVPCVEVAENDINTICYTSGTLGIPKGAVLTHGNILSLVHAIIILVKNQSLFNLSHDDIHISYLPLAHVFERCICTAFLFYGGAIGFYGGDTSKIMEDVRILKPTVFVSVPRIFTKLVQTIQMKLKKKPLLLRKLFDHAYKVKLNRLQKHGKFSHWFWDPILFNNLKASFGGRVRTMICGSAPLDPEVLKFVKIVFSCEFYEGYGQTETGGACIATEKSDWSTGHVGSPFPSIEIKLTTHPELDYGSVKSPEPIGELCVRGSSVFKEYYKAEELTKETIAPDGWVKTGDIVKIDSQGRVVIIDRIKSLFKLSQGEYVSPEKVENILCRSDQIEFAFLYGESIKNYAIALILPTSNSAIQWAIENGKISKIEYEKMPESELLKLRKDIIQENRDLLTDYIADIVFGFSKNNYLNGYEIPKAIYLLDEPFTIESDLITSTFKVKRKNVVEKFKPQLDQLYQKLDKK